MGDASKVLRAVGRSFRDLAMYAGVSALIIAAIFGLFAAGMSWQTFVRWIGLGIVTSILFGYYLLEYRTSWRTARFWIVTLALLTSHFGLWIILIKRSPEWKFVWFAPGVLETLVFQYFVNRFVLSAENE